MKQLSIDLLGEPPSAQVLSDVKASLMRDELALRRCKTRMAWFGLITLLGSLGLQWGLFSYGALTGNAWALMIVFWLFFITLALEAAGLVAPLAWLVIFRSDAAARAEAITSELAALCEIDSETRPDECVAFVNYCQQDETVRKYQHQLSRQGRRPIVAEYFAAKEWLANGRAEQQTKERAREACAQLDSMV